MRVAGEIGFEDVEVAVAVVIHKGATGGPACLLARYARFFAHVSEGAIAVVVVEGVLAVVGEEKIFETIVVVVAYANSLPPAGARQAGFAGDVGKGAVAIVFEQIADRFFARGET